MLERIDDVGVETGFGFVQSDQTWRSRAQQSGDQVQEAKRAVRQFAGVQGPSYPNEDSALKVIYMAIREASKKWTKPIRQWKAALNHFAIMFEDRMPEMDSK